MISKELQVEFDDLKPIKQPCVRIEVKFEKGRMIKELALALYSEFQRMAPYAGYAPISELEAEDIEKYLCTLLYLRVAKVRGLKDKTIAQYNTLGRRVAVPVIWSHVLVAIGISYDQDYNLEFVPAYTIEGSDLLSPDQLSAISGLFRQFEQEGMKVVYGISTSMDGELDFMAMSHVADEVMSYRKAHPVYGFLASFVAEKQLNEVTGSISRILYGYDTDYRLRLRALVLSVNHARD